MAGVVGAMAGVVCWVATVEYGIDSVQIVNVAVSVVIDLVAGNFRSVTPQVSSQILVSRSGSGINNSHDDRFRIVANRPALCRVDVGISKASRLAGVVQVPETSVGER